MKFADNFKSTMIQLLNMCVCRLKNQFFLYSKNSDVLIYLGRSVSPVCFLGDDHYNLKPRIIVDVTC